MNSTNNKAFTLIELLVVISIIGILATLLMANVAGVRERARDVQRKSDVNQIQKALEMYKNSQTTPKYPGNAEGNLGALVPNYLKTAPHDPKYNPACTENCWDYSYTQDATDVLKYILIACLENASDPQKDSAKDANCSIASYTRTEL